MFGESKNNSLDRINADQRSINHKISALFELLSELHGSEQLILKAGKLDALQLMDSSKVTERLVALERLVYEDPTIDQDYAEADLDEVIKELEDNIAHMIAKQTVEK